MSNSYSVAWLVKTVLTEEEKRYLMALALELVEIRKQLNQIAETMAKLSDKQFSESLNMSKDGVTEGQVDSYQLALQKRLDVMEDKSE